MKPHYPVLDGLRGTATLLVVLFHFFEAYYPVATTQPIHHGYLAVDFFYLLSGFVIGYAYDDRWGKMGVIDFLKIRLVRLHPLVILGVFIGAVCFWFNPYTSAVPQMSVLKLIGIMLISFTLLPSPDVRGGWGETHSLDGPCWSLLQEYIANVMYAVYGHKMSKMVLWVVVIFSGIVLCIVAVWHGNIATGWRYRTLWIGFIRMTFPFFAGLLLFRTGKQIRIPMAYTACSLLLMVLLFMPIFKYNGLYEAFCIIIIFPVIVAAGAGGRISGRWAKLCKFSGNISYPVYILHYPFVSIYTSWVILKKPVPTTIITVAAGLFIFFLLLAYAALKLYDEPLRAWLKKRYLAPIPVIREVQVSQLLK